MAEHTLFLLQSGPPYPSSDGFLCNLCHEPGRCPVYRCSHCTDFDLHVSCAATLPTPHTHFTHPLHPLHLTPCGSQPRKCNSCGCDILTCSFRCAPCGFDMHPMCARAPRFILHRHHQHPLELLDSGSELRGKRGCSGCQKVVTNNVYYCRICKFCLHQACAALPTKIKHVRHQGHMLTLLNPSPKDKKRHPTYCAECREHIEGYSFQCKTCNYSLHPICANVVHELPFHSTDGAESNVTSSTYTHPNSNFFNSAISPLMQAFLSASLLIDTAHSHAWEVVKRFPQFVYEIMKAIVHFTAKHTQSNQQDTGRRDECPTCLEGFDSRNPRKTTRCGHSFHRSCILEWMERSKDCPVCRRNIANNQTMKFSSDVG